MKCKMILFFFSFIIINIVGESCNITSKTIKPSENWKVFPETPSTVSQNTEFLESCFEHSALLEEGIVHIDTEKDD